MNVEFFTAVLKEDSASEVRVWCAVTPLGLRAFREDQDEIVLSLTVQDLSDVKSIATVDLSSLERNLFEAIVDLILRSGLLGKTGVKNKGDAVLFMLTNEALHTLAQIEREEEAEGEKEPPHAT